VSDQDFGQQFRHFMRRYATGVTVVTSQAGDVQHGMTANSVTTLSLDPPSYLICVAKSARLHPVVEESRKFCVNLLAADQAEVSATFAKTDLTDDERWVTADWRESELGPRLIDGCTGYAECKVTASYDGGTHTIYIGEVLRLELGEDKAPLIFYGGTYRHLAEHQHS
jgi:flavin reductase (DIM6/NTAB) family NADH-FMN oxidoreductase RutF